MAVLGVTEETFDAEVLKSSLPVLVEVWASWAGACRFTGPIVELFADSHGEKMHVVKVNLDESVALMSSYGTVTAPVFLVFVGGELVKKLDGSRPLEVLESELAEFL